jgi:hypothetical protein
MYTAQCHVTDLWNRLAEVWLWPLIFFHQGSYNNNSPGNFPIEPCKYLSRKMTNLKLDTWDFKPLCKAYDRFSRRMFKPTTDFIKFWKWITIQHIISPSCINLWIVFSILKCNTLTWYFDTSSNATDWIFIYWIMADKHLPQNMT